MEHKLICSIRTCLRNIPSSEKLLFHDIFTAFLCKNHDIYMGDDQFSFKNKKPRLREANLHNGAEGGTR